ncbi:MAG: hypothetical protein KAS07_05685 [Candidatus Pacebacteria bacterium]|nr:hypothetical protein [Candidatus Paceibacterota bacterium]
MTGYLGAYGYDGSYSEFMTEDFDEYITGGLEHSPLVVEDFLLQDRYEGKKVINKLDGTIISVSAYINVNGIHLPLSPTIMGVFKTVRRKHLTSF